MNADEFKIFTRPGGDISKLLDQIPKEPTSRIVEKYQTALEINECMYDPIRKDALDQ